MAGNFDTGEADNIMNELLNNGFSSNDPMGIITPKIMKLEEVIFPGEIYIPLSFTLVQ